MRQPRFSFVPVMDHEIHVTEWGNPENPPLVMWHGLARTGRDFDELAAGLSDAYFVICPDTIGRGLSSWSKDPEAEYCIEYLTGIATDLLDHYKFDKVGWIGTSMGGLVGMRMASGPLADRLTSLIINDIGPEIPQSAIDRILLYASDLPEFEHVAQAELWLRSTYAPFGPAPDGFWQRMARNSVRRKSDGRVTLHYDPKLVVQFSASVHELSSWERYASIEVPTHVIWGKHSDILTADIVERMKNEGPRPAVTRFDECGHAPSLSNKQDMIFVREILQNLRY